MRNVTLPAVYNHVVVPVTASLAEDPAVRDWINAYVPGQNVDTSSLPATGCRPRAVGGRRLVQHQEALGPRSAALGARAARPRRDGKQAALSGWRRG